MSVVMHFSTFLKFLTLSTGDKIRQLENYSTPGGFDFYRPSRDAVREYGEQRNSRANLSSQIQQRAAANAVCQNVEIFENVADWLDKQRTVRRSSPKKGLWNSPRRVFSVHIEPEIGIEAAGKLRIVAVYPRRDVRINRDQAGAGILLLQRAYRGTGAEEFGVIDAYGQKAWWSPTNVSSALLDREIETLESELVRIVR